MSTTKQKEAARRNLEKARAAQRARPGRRAKGPGLSTAEQNQLDDDAFAFPRERKEPLTDARHVRNAIARFDQVEDVSDGDRELAFANSKKAAEHYHVAMQERSWHDLGSRPHTRNRSED